MAHHGPRVHPGGSRGVLTTTTHRPGPSGARPVLVGQAIRTAPGSGRTTGPGGRVRNTQDLRQSGGVDAVPYRDTAGVWNRRRCGAHHVVSIGQQRVLPGRRGRRGLRLRLLYFLFLLRLLLVMPTMFVLVRPGTAPRVEVRKGPRGVATSWSPGQQIRRRDLAHPGVRELAGRFVLDRDGRQGRDPGADDTTRRHRPTPPALAHQGRARLLRTREGDACAGSPTPGGAAHTPRPRAPWRAASNPHREMRGREPVPRSGSAPRGGGRCSQGACAPSHRRVRECERSACSWLPWPPGARPPIDAASGERRR